uniref:Putative basic tail protein n=1 Tax=Ixodes ricinus TaxID=34613 RepID=A0A0K8R3J4_IXORI
MGLAGITLVLDISQALRSCRRLITLVLVSLAFFGSAAAHDCRNGTRPSSEREREGCDFYCWNDATRSYEQFFFTDGEQCFYKTGEKGICRNGECNLTDDAGTHSNDDYETPAPTKKPKQKKKKPKKTKKPKETSTKDRNG